MTLSTSLLTGASLSLFVLSACASDQTAPPAQAPPTTASVTSVQSDNSPNGGNLISAPSSSDTRSGSTDVQPGNPPILSDAQIAKVADTINSGEIDQAKYALLHATDPRIKKFAQHMVTAHGTIGQTMGAVLQKESINPLPSTLSAKLSSDGRSTMTDLESKTGADFDKTYISDQAKEHKDALELFDNDLIPRAHDPQLKTALMQVRPMVAEHLKEAEDLKRALP